MWDPPLAQTILTSRKYEILEFKGCSIHFIAQDSLDTPFNLLSHKIFWEAHGNDYLAPPPS